ncbi:50S ribosomal protein L18 [Candidatus Dependentiae bacterium]|nr:50S ribosomal protein L18 [Candidatus Dependentiae bacterium]
MFVSLQKKAQKKLKLKRNRRKLRVKSNQSRREQKPRVTVFRSLKHIYAQVIDDLNQKVLISFSSLNLKNQEKLDKKAEAKLVGVELGKMAVEKDVKDVFFDRGRYLYHGRISALVEGLRDSGMQI